jgi:NifU-like protein involved in Fe-S cluster formation
MASRVTATDLLYTRDILRLASAIPYQVALADLPEADELRSPTCGSRIRLVIERDGLGRISALRIAVEACAFGQAAAALVSASAIGQSTADLSKIDHHVAEWLGGTLDISPWPGLNALEPARARSARHGAILLPFRALAREARKAAP